MAMTRIRGHLSFGRGGGHHAETSRPVPGAIPGPDALELANLAAKPGQFLTLGAGQPVVTSARVTIALCDPVVYRLRGRLELLFQLLRPAPGLDQFDHLGPEFRRVRGAMSLHDGHLLFQRIDVHETGSTPPGRILL